MAAVVVDADGHVLEPLSAFDACAESHRLRVSRDPYGLDHVFAGDQEIVTVSLGKLGTPGSDMADLAHSPEYDEAQPGGFDPELRLRDMDGEGIDLAVLYPSLGLNFWSITDTWKAASLARAYNDWLAEYCAADPARLFGAAMVPWQSIDASVAELRRAHDDLGFRAVFLRPNPCLGRTITHPAHEPFWELAEELDVTVGIHEGSSNMVETLASDRKPFNPLVLHAVSHAFEQMLACAQLITQGVMERHPGLRFVFLEAGGGWGPYWLWRLDEQVRGFGGYCPEMKLLPSEYFNRQCWISFEIDEPSLPALLPVLGEDRAVWGSDYPHHDSTFPGAVQQLRDTIATLPDETRRKVLGTNALDCYHLPMTAADVVHSYFAAIRAKDADALRGLFTDDAALVTLAGTFTGPDAIAGFYRNLAFQTDDLWPEPGPLIVDGPHVAVEIRLRMNGKISLVGDFFTLRDGLIARLLVCNGPPAE